MTRAELLDKFERNAASVLPAARIRELAAATAALETLPDASVLVQLSARG
jgi:hypothetical protein